MRVKYKEYIFVILLIGVFASIAFALSWGSYTISPLDIFKVFIGQGSKMQNFAIFTLRLPRIVLAMLVACALSVSGGILQVITKNELADAGIVGINAGAALAAVLFISIGGLSYYEAMSDLSIFMLPLVALCGAFISSLIIYFVACKDGLRPKRLILSGIGITIAMNALTSFFTFKSTAGDYNRVLVWTNGSLWGSSWKEIVAVFPIIVFAIGIVLYYHKTLDVLCLGDELACGLGVDTNKVRKYFLGVAVLLAGSATAFAGNISFLGLLGPHLARQLVGPKHKNYLVVAMAISCIVILVGDTISRNLFSPLEIPVGITISMIGVPYFVYLLGKEG